MAVLAPRMASLRTRVRFRFSNTTLAVAVGVLVLWLVAVAVGPMLIRYDPITQVLADRLQPPSGSHLLGTDAFGRDILSRIVNGSRLSLGIAFTTAAISAVIGTALGLASGFMNKAGAVITRVNDGVMAFPATLLAIAMIAVIGRGALTTIIALTVVFTPQFVRIAYGESRGLKQKDFVASARAAGCRLPRILLRHVAPYIAAAVTVQATYVFAMAILSEAGLSFIGAGVPPPAPSWGTMINEGAIYIGQSGWMLWPVGVAMTSVVLALNVVGDRLQDVLDPRRSGR